MSREIRKVPSRPALEQPWPEWAQRCAAGQAVFPPAAVGLAGSRYLPEFGRVPRAPCGARRGGCRPAACRRLRGRGGCLRAARWRSACAQPESLMIFAAFGYITKPSTVLVLTDSANVIGWLSQGFKRKNPLVAALCGQIDQVIAATGLVVRYAKVDGHAGVALNELVDRLASRQVELGKAGACQAAPLV